MKGSDNDWFNDPVTDSRIEFGVGAITIQSEATLVRNPKLVEDVLGKFREKYNSMWSESYYAKRDVCVEVPM